MVRSLPARTMRTVPSRYINRSAANRVTRMRLELAALTASCSQDACYDGSTVILTGATGFLGKVVLEKILYSLRGVKKIYVLLRPRGDTPAEARLKKEILSWQCFDRLRAERPDFEGASQRRPTLPMLLQLRPPPPPLAQTACLQCATRMRSCQHALR